MTKRHEVLGTLYKQVGNWTYVAIATVDLSVPPGDDGNYPTTTKATFMASQRFGTREVTYGSLPHAIDEAARPILRAPRMVAGLQETLPRDIQRLLERKELDGGAVSVTLPDGAPGDELIYRQGEIYKDALLTSAIHVRTLLEDFSGRGNIPIALYDYEGNPAGNIPLSEVFNTLAHNRYCVVSGEFVHDVFSFKGQLGADDLVGAKMRTNDLLNAVCDFISRIRVRDFVGVLRSRLEGLSIGSERKDVIFAVQNIDAIGQIIEERLVTLREEPRMISVLKNRLTAREDKLLEEAERRGESQIIIKGGAPRFRLGDRLGDKKIDVYIPIDGEMEKFELGWDELFRGLVQMHGNESLVPHDVLISRFEYFDKLGR